MKDAPTATDPCPPSRVHDAALFDMDGLLIDSEASIMQAWLAVAAEMSVELPPAVYLSVIGRSAVDGFARLAQAFGGRQRLELARGRVLARLDAVAVAERFPLKPGANELLVELAGRGVPCAVASSSFRKEIDARLTAVGVRDCFAAVVGGDEVTIGKPHPEIYQRAAQRLGLEANRCIGFEDSHAGAEAVLAAGAKLVLVPDLLPPTDALRDRACSVLTSLQEAVPHVPRWFGDGAAHRRRHGSFGT